MSKKNLLSVLIPSIEERADQLIELKEKLRVISDGYPVEIISLCDNRELSCGQKKECLIRMAQGEYIVIVDDDDTLRDDYFEQVIPVLELKPDCIGYLVELVGMDPMRYACISTRYPEWCNNIDGFDLVRYTHEKTPVKRIHALEAGLSWMRYHDDYCFSMNLKRCGKLNNEIFINEPLYIYRYEYHNDPQTKYGFNKIYQK